MRRHQKFSIEVDEGALSTLLIKNKNFLIRNVCFFWKITISEFFFSCFSFWMKILIGSILQTIQLLIVN